MVCNQNTVSCAMVGDGMVGKSSLARRFVGSQFSAEYVATVAEKYTGAVSAYGEKYSVTVQEDNAQSSAAKDADVIVVCYSAVDRESYENAKSFWVPEVRKLNKKKPIVFVATQCDIRDDNNCDHVSDTEGHNLKKSNNADFYNKCSAATNDGVNKVFESVVCSAVKNRKKKSNLVKRVFGR